MENAEIRGITIEECKMEAEKIEMMVKNFIVPS